jgi:membrane protein required for colicin V production
MTTLDIILSLLLLGGAIRGFIKGFIFEIAILGVIFVLYFFGFQLADWASVYVGRVLDVKSVTLHYVSLFVVWIGVSIAIHFIAKLLEGLVKVVALGIFNKFAGALFGLIKYTFLLSVFLFFLNKIDISTSWFNADKKAESVLYYPILRIAPTVISVLKN